MNYPQKLSKAAHYTALLLVVIFGLTTIIGTGGSSNNGDNGDEISPAGYTGETSQARISENNAETIATAAFNKIQNTENVSDVYGPASMDSQNTSQMSLADELPSGRMEESANEDSQACLYGGEIFFNETTKEEGDKIISIVSINFLDCNQDNVTTIDGEAEAEVVLNCLDYDQQGEMCVHYSMNMKMEFIEIRVSDGKSSETLTGTFKISDVPDDDQLQMISTIDMLVKDNNTKKTYKIYDLVGRFYQDSTYGIAQEVEGRFYHHDYGYVDIYTEERLKIYPGDMYPSEGKFVVEGANGTKAAGQFIDNETFQVKADTSGNGIYDYDSGLIRWDSFEDDNGGNGDDNDGEAFNGDEAAINDFVGTWEGNIEYADRSESYIDHITLKIIRDDDILEGTLVFDEDEDEDEDNADYMEGTVSDGKWVFDLSNSDPGHPDCANWDVSGSAELLNNFNKMKISGSGTFCGPGGGQQGAFEGTLNKQ